MKLASSIEKAINEQINKELYSEYLYLSMAAYAASVNLDGFSRFFVAQAAEEHIHAMKFFNYLNEKGGRVLLETIEKPKAEFASITEAVTMALEHEGTVTASINNLMDLAIKENDHSAKIFLQWYVSEQDEEEASFESLVHKLSLVGESGNGLIMLDQQVGNRPVPNGEA